MNDTTRKLVMKWADGYAREWWTVLDATPGAVTSCAALAVAVARMAGVSEEELVRRVRALIASPGVRYIGGDPSDLTLTLDRSAIGAAPIEILLPPDRAAMSRDKAGEVIGMIVHTARTKRSGCVRGSHVLNGREREWYIAASSTRSRFEVQVSGSRYDRHGEHTMLSIAGMWSLVACLAEFISEETG